MILTVLRMCDAHIQKSILSGDRDRKDYGVTQSNCNVGQWLISACQKVPNNADLG